jgi:hypothetical protein
MKQRDIMIQDEIPHPKPALKLVFWVPATNLSLIQDEIRLRRLTSNEFAAPGISRRMIQDVIARPP